MRGPPSLPRCRVILPWFLNHWQASAMVVLPSEMRRTCAMGCCRANNWSLLVSTLTSALQLSALLAKVLTVWFPFGVCLLFQLSESSSSCSSIHSMDTTSSGMSSLMNPLSSPPSCNNNPKIHKRSVSVTSITSTVLPPVYNQQNEDTCIIRISIEDNNGNMYKSIMVRLSDHRPGYSPAMSACARAFVPNGHVPLNQCQSLPGYRLIACSLNFVFYIEAYSQLTML